MDTLVFVILAGLQSSEEVYDVHISIHPPNGRSFENHLPLIQPVVAIVLLTSIESFKIFDIIFV